MAVSFGFLFLFPIVFLFPREVAGDAAERAGIALRFAPEGLRTDNALMIAYAAAHHLAAGRRSPSDIDIQPNFDPAALCL